MSKKYCVAIYLYVLGLNFYYVSHTCLIQSRLLPVYFKHSLFQLTVTKSGNLYSVRRVRFPALEPIDSRNRSYNVTLVKFYELTRIDELFYIITTNVSIRQSFNFVSNFTNYTEIYNPQLLSDCSAELSH